MFVRHNCMHLVRLVEWLSNDGTFGISIHPVEFVAGDSLIVMWQIIL